MLRTTLTCLLVSVLVGSLAHADDAWKERVEKEIAEVEKAMARLDKEKADPKATLRERAEALDARMVKLAKKAGLALEPQFIYEGSDEQSLLSSVTQAAVGVKSRLRKLKKFKAEKKKKAAEEKAEERKKDKPSSSSRKPARRGSRFGKKLWRNYRKDVNLTVLTTDAGMCDDIEVAAVVHFKGMGTGELEKPEVAFTFTSTQKKARFAGVRHATFYAEDHCITMKVKRTPTMVAGSVIEILIGKVGLESFAKIGYADRLKIGIANWKFEATAELKACLREIAELLKLPNPYEKEKGERLILRD